MVHHKPFLVIAHQLTSRPNIMHSPTSRKLSSSSNQQKSNFERRHNSIRFDMWHIGCTILSILTVAQIVFAFGHSVLNGVNQQKELTELAYTLAQLHSNEIPSRVITVKLVHWSQAQHTCGSFLNCIIVCSRPVAIFQTLDTRKTGLTSIRTVVNKNVVKCAEK